MARRPKRSVRLIAYASNIMIILICIESNIQQFKHNQPLTAPAVIPPTMFFPKIKYTTITGRIDIAINM